MEVFAAESYRQLLKFYLTEGRSRAPRGRTTRLAEDLKCHVTFVSQVVRGLADFSHDQGLAFCKSAQYTVEETEFFLKLLTFERAGTKELKSFLKKRLTHSRNENLRAGKRFKSKGLKPEDQQKYFCDPGLQLVHIATQLKQTSTLTSLAKFLGCYENVLQPYVRELLRMRLVELNEKSELVSLQDFVHLKRGTAEFQFYTNFWRQYVRLQVLGNSKRQEEDISLTSLVVTSSS